MEMAHEEFGPQSFIESLTLRRPFSRSIRATFEPQAKTNGSFRVRHSSGYNQGWLLETETAIARRNPRDLPAISDLVVSGPVVSGPAFARIEEPPPGYAHLDVAVSLMKYLADKVEQRHWWLCQLNFDSPLTSYPLEVRVHQNFYGTCIVFHVAQRNTVIGAGRFMVDNLDS
jgi:hypothetical protein